MKLLRYGTPGQEKPGLLDKSGQIRDLSGAIPDITGDTLTPQSLQRIQSLDPAKLPAVAGSPRLGPCVSRVGKFICIGLNYSDHAAEAGMKPPAEPVVFMKATSAITGPNDNVVIPRTSVKSDWEVELGVIIGSQTKYVSESEALNHVAGYCVVNDLSERTFQLEGTGQWVKGKSADTFGPIGPWLVTRDEVPDPQNLQMWLKINGHQFQNGNTKTMIFSILSHRRLPEPLHVAPTWRHHLHRHAAGGGHGPKAAQISRAWGQDRTRHPRSRRPNPISSSRRVGARHAGPVMSLSTLPAATTSALKTLPHPALQKFLRPMRCRPMVALAQPKSMPGFDVFKQFRRHPVRSVARYNSGKPPAKYQRDRLRRTLETQAASVCPNPSSSGSADELAPETPPSNSANSKTTCSCASNARGTENSEHQKQTANRRCSHVRISSSDRAV